MWLKSDVIPIKGPHYAIRRLQITRLANCALAQNFLGKGRHQLSSDLIWSDLVWFDLIWFEHKVSVGIPFAVVLWSSMTWGGCNESHTSLNYFNNEHLQTFKQGNIYILKPCKDAEYAETVIVRLISSQVDDWSVITERLQAESNLISSATICYIIASTSWSRSSVGPLWHRGCV